MLITIKRGPKPIIKPVTRRNQFTPIYDAIDKLKPGEWFEIPGSITPTAKDEQKVRTGVRNYCKKNNLDGIVVGKIAASGAMMVFAASDGL